MARHFVPSITGVTGTTLPYFVNIHASQVQIGIAVYQSTVGAGGPATGQYAVQYTFDDYFATRVQDGRPRYANVTSFTRLARWTNFTNFNAIVSTSIATINDPVAAIRLAVLSAGTTTSFEMRVIQAGIAGS